MVALLSGDRHVAKSQRPQWQLGEAPVDAFNLLQAEDIWLMRAHEALDEIESQPDRVDVPRREAKTREERPKKRRPTAARGWAPEARFLRARAGREAGTGGPHLRLDGGHYR